MVSDKLYRRMQLGCSCGHVSRSMSAEAYHRHNFPMLCKTRAVRLTPKQRATLDHLKVQSILDPNERTLGPLHRRGLVDKHPVPGSIASWWSITDAGWRA